MAKLAASTSQNTIQQQQQQQQCRHMSKNSSENSNENIKKQVNLMRKTLKDSSTKEQNWENVWKEKVTPWDLGKPTPVLFNELFSWDAERQTHVPIYQQHDDGGKFRSLIPGCGGGYDLILLYLYQQHLLSSKKEGTSNGVHDAFLGDGKSSVVVGMDISPTSLSVARRNVDEWLDGSKTYQELSLLSPGLQNDDWQQQQTQIILKSGDFLAHTSQWKDFLSFLTEKETPKAEEITINISNEKEETFDFIFDYVFFCALPPSLRDQWGQRMAQLIRPNSGRLLTVMFPIFPSSPTKGDGKGDNNEKTMKGPPYPVTVKDYQSVLEPHGFVIIEPSPYESSHSAKERVGKELVCWWKLA